MKPTCMYLKVDLREWITELLFTIMLKTSSRERLNNSFDAIKRLCIIAVEIGQ